jgi:molybdenum ABC transporter molybdate-binding protein
MTMTTGTAVADQTVRLHAAGSLRAAMTDISDAFEAAHGGRVERTFGPSGLLRQRIEGGEAAEVYASANMRHPSALADAGRAAPVALFARNRLCALAQPEVAVETATLLDALLDPELRIGTSTPKADPAGDYAFAVFDRAGALRPGAAEALKAKALKLTGGPDSATAPEGRNPYGWVMSEGRADVFLTYCTNAVLAGRDTPGLRIVALPDDLAVGADYGLKVMHGSREGAWKLAFFILSPPAQRILAGYGFAAGGIPASD